MNHANQAFQPLVYREFSPEEMLARATALLDQLSARRTVREFSDRPVDRKIIEAILLTASTAPSGANKQPWTFCVVSDPAVKAQIRTAAEKEEYENYHGRMSDDWLADLQKFGTDWHKPFLTTAPYLIVVFKKAYDLGSTGEKEKNYYVTESVGLACGLLISAIHHAGLVTVTHTPSPLNFLQKILGRPDNERPFLLLPVGYPAADAQVPSIGRKGLDEISVWFE
ncbi:nitroreductase family protein [Neolewinella lacunae]|uniref:Nitroreductase family protein n=1 Tax=Neolewinella lacunae TaxID=1517758 RepID=A0A923PMI8_9BACT|nr:nitroreductase family protein [Neolewinella lacunae]MBC6995451.1 nitroreductase family protein [Neolewinella lacunae]MDN3635039.1 nitroreductase family protein [Neolewinella lacunae]